MAINFGKLSKSKAGSVPKTLSELFDQLDRKQTHQILRPVQTEALNQLDQQLGQKDVVIKLSTGSGKTIVGLVYAEYMRRRYPGEPVLYLVPTWQLIAQVQETGDLIGVPVSSEESELPMAAVEGKVVFACTYDRLFNSRNVFERRGVVPSAIVLDDVHSGIDRVRGKYTVPLPGSAYTKVRAIFQPLCEKADPAIWRAIANNEADARYEVPYWLWIPQIDQVGSILEAVKDDKELMFCWGNVSRYLDAARLCISGTGAELSLPVAASEENRSYASTKHRLFMSASIKDGSGLIRDLGCDPEAMKRTIEPPSDRGAGERMILPISLIDPSLKKADVAQMCASFATKANVVVLTSSEKQAHHWCAAGAVFKSGDDVAKAVEQLRHTKKGKFYVFAQRFDGVDLPDDACRILVIDGIPSGERLCDIIDAERQKNSPGYNVRVVNRFEQALGRAVRSSADYAAILLVGRDLASFVGRRDVKELLEGHTREQIELGIDLANQLKDGAGTNGLGAIHDAIEALLSRDEDWKKSHRERVAAVVRQPRAGVDLTQAEKAALAERQAWGAAKSRNHQGAVAALQAVINAGDLHPLQRAELVVRKASFMHHFDPGTAAAGYRSAFELNSLLPRPGQLPDKSYSRIGKQAALVRDYIQNYTSVNAAISRLEEIRAKLSYAALADVVEEGLHELGQALGAGSSRPEKETGRGPDNLWIFEDIGLCIEAKSEKSAPIFKSDAEQLLLAVQWCGSKTDVPKEAIVPVFATNSLKADRSEDVSFGPRALTEKVAMELVDGLRDLINGVSFDGPLFNDASQVQRLLAEKKLTGRAIRDRLRETK